MTLLAITLLTNLLHAYLALHGDLGGLLYEYLRKENRLQQPIVMLIS